MTDKIVSVTGVAALAKQGMWPHTVRTEVGVLASGEPVSTYLGAVIVDCRPDRNRRAR